MLTRNVFVETNILCTFALPYVRCFLKIIGNGFIF